VLETCVKIGISSPQEIKAFSSEMANRVFRNIASHLDTAEDLENLK
jgi:sRNA-binding carbon storage regulator CsrA